MTPDKLPVDLIKNIWADAERYAGEKVKAINEEHFNVYNAHIAGATAWAEWKIKHDELQATIDEKIDKVLHAERNKMQAKISESEAEWAKKCHTLATILQEFVSKHEAGLLPDRFVYDKAIKILNDGK